MFKKPASGLINNQGVSPAVYSKWAALTCYTTHENFCYPTSLFTALEPHNPWIHKSYVAHERRATDFKAKKM